MAGRIGAFDWAATALGPIQAWPQSLRAAVDVMLGTAFAATLHVGPDLIFLHNDAYRPLAPLDRDILGLSTPEIYPAIRDQIETVMARARSGETFVLEDQTFPVWREGVADSATFTMSHQPVRDDNGAIVAVLVIGIETTERRRAETALRKSEALRTIALTGGGMGTWRWDLENRLIWGDARFLALWGFPPSDDAHPLSLFTERMSPVGAGEMEVIVTEAIAAGKEFDGPLEICAGPTAGRWIRWRGQGDGGTPSSLYGVTFDITEQRQADAALRESEERQTFLLKLSDALRPLTDPIEITAQATRILGEYMQADRTFIAMMEPDGVNLEVRHEYLRPGASSVIGHHNFDQFGTFVSPRLIEGHIMAVEDVSMLALTETERAHYAVVGIAAYLLVPLVRNGRFAACFTCNHQTPRPWTEADKNIVRQTADRTWAAIERARAEAALRDSEARLAAAFESAPVGLSVTDALGASILSNTEYRRFLPTGIIPSRDVARVGRWRSWDAEGRPLAPHDFPGARALRGERVVPGREMLYSDDDGREIWTSVATIPIRNGTGEVTGLATVIEDIDERKRAAAALEEVQTRFSQFAASSSDALWIRDAKTLAFQFCSPALKKVFGVAPEAAIADARLLHSLIVPEQQEEIERRVERIAGGEQLVSEYRIRRPTDQALRSIRSTGFPLRDENGAVRSIAAISSDVTEEKLAIERQAALLAELQHRVRNTLAIVRSIARQTADKSENIDDFRLHFDGRISAFARTQAHVTRDPTRGVSLKAIVADELLAHQIREGGRVSVGGPDVRLTPKMADSLGLALHELATNAVKYGALRDETGRLTITWRVEETAGPKLRLEWTERLRRDIETVQRRAGFGTELLQRSLVYDLDATVDFDLTRRGLHCAITVPLPA